MVGRVKREIHYLKLLRHPHIIKLYEVLTTPTDIIMVMEYAGGELFNYIVERGRMSEDDARKFFQQIISAVEYCHKYKIVHRDLKPENVLLDELNNVKIADFGLSNLMSDGDFLKTSCGSPNYAAPEVISGKYYAGPEVDVWSCGVILYVMLCGRLPFDDEYIPNLFKKINGGIFTLPSFLSPATKQLLQQILVVDPLKRITIPEIRQTEWFNTNLPDYLKPIPDIQEDTYQTVNESIITDLMHKMNFKRDVIIQALKEKENNQIKVAYQLAIDVKKLADDKQASRRGTVQPFLYGTSPSKWEKQQQQQGGGPPVDSSIGFINPALQKESGDPQPPVKKSKARSKWHFGIRSRSPPLDIMLEIYRALKNVGMEWKVIDPFHIRAKYISPLDKVIKIDIQLYKIETHNYLVDFKNSTAVKSFESPASPMVDNEEVRLRRWGDVDKGKEKSGNVSAFAFFDVCSKLITELAISA